MKEGVTVTKSDRKKLAKQAVDLAKLSVSEDMDKRHVLRLLESICNTLWETYYQAPPSSDEEKAALREVLDEAQGLMKTKEAGSMFYQAEEVLRWHGRIGQAGGRRGSTHPAGACRARGRACEQGRRSPCASAARRGR